MASFTTCLSGTSPALVPLALTETSVNNWFQRNICSGEDRYIFSDDICAVFDGHGGIIVSDTLAKNLEPVIRSKLVDIDTSNEDAIRSAIIECFQEIDTQILEMIKFKPNCGSTCTMVIRLDNKLVLINLGDSNLVLYVNGEKRIVMKEHLYSNLEEKEVVDSLVEAGGICLEVGWAPKILNDDDVTMVRSDLIMLHKDGSKIVPTRNFGHRCWKQTKNMSVVPYIEFVDMIEDEVYEVVLASDGVFDILANIDEIYPIIKDSDNKSKALVEFAEARWRKGWNYKMEGHPDLPNQQMGVDDITAIYCRFTV